MGQEKKQSRERLVQIIFFLVLASTAFIFGFHLIEDWDFLWHLKTGEIIFQNGPPKTDLYSFTASGEEWIDAQWLFQLIIYLIYRWSGFAGQSWALAFLVLILWSLIWKLVRDDNIFPVMFPLCLLSLWAMSPRFQLRPEMFSYIFTALFLLLLEKYRSGSGKIFLLPVLQLLWANLEGLWPIGLVIISAYFVQELFENYFFRLKNSNPSPGRLFIILILCIFASIITPYHFKGFIFPLQLFQDIVSSSNFLKKIIEEAQPPFPAFRYPFVQIPLLILLVLSGLSFFINLKKPRLAHILLWLAFLFLALTALRNIAFICILSLLVISTNLREAMNLGNKHSALKPALKFPSALLGIALCVFLVISVITGRFYLWDKTNRQFGTGLDFAKYPVAAANFLKAIKWKGNLFNQLQMGGYFIALGYPDWRVYIDGRLQVYGQDRVKTFIKSLKDYETFQQEENKYGFSAVILDLRDAMVKPLAKNLLADLTWAPVYADQNSIVFLKDNESQHELVILYRIILH